MAPIGLLVEVAVEHAQEELLVLAEMVEEFLALQEEELLALHLLTPEAVEAVQV